MELETINFTLCERVLTRAYNGANGKKIAVKYDGDVWMLKTISDVPLMTDLHRDFLIHYLNLRREKLFA